MMTFILAAALLVGALFVAAALDGGSWLPPRPDNVRSVIDWQST